MKKALLANKKPFDKQRILFLSRIIGAKTRRVLWLIIRTMLIIGISFVILYPLIIKLSVSIMSQSDMLDTSVRWVAKSPTFDNFVRAIQIMNFWEAFKNTAVMSILVTVLQVSTCTLASYAFARLKYPGSKIVYILMIFTLIAPPQTYMIGMYSQFRFFDPFGLMSMIRGTAGLMNTFIPMAAKAFFGTGIRNGLYVYIMVQFFRNVPNELEEAAHVDGASSFKTFMSVMIPNAVPAIVTISVFSIVWQWNDSFFSTLFTPQTSFLSSNLYNIDDMIKKIDERIFNTPAYASVLKNAAALLVAFPIILLFIGAQKFFVENLERSGIVG